MPGTRCAMYGCGSTYSSNKTEAGNETKIMFHRFPRAKDADSKLTRKTWINQCWREDKWNPDTSRICSKHFTETDYERDLESELLGLPIRKILKKDAVPNIQLPKKQNHMSEAACVRSKRHAKRRRKQEFNDMMSSTDNCVFINGSDVLQERVSLPDEPDNEKNPLHDPLEIAHENPVINSPGPSQISSKRISKGVHNNWEQKYAKLLEEHKRMKLKFSKKIKSLNDQLRYYKAHSSPELDIAEINSGQLLRKILTENQIALLSNRKRKVNWTNEEISVALTISSYSKKCYVYLQNNTNFPLPSLATLKRFEAIKSEGIM